MSTPSTSNKGSDIMIALGAILCIALGASMTYWLTHKTSGVVVSAPVATPVAAPAAGTAASPVGSAKPAAENSDFLPVTFATLSSYYYDLPALDEKATKAPKDQIPQPIKDLNKKKIALQGFMVPIDLKNGKTTKFLLVKDQSLCCFGRMPRMNEWVSVKMKPGKSARVIQDQPVTVFGNMEVGELIESGEVQSVYRIDSDDVAGPLDL